MDDTTPTLNQVAPLLWGVAMVTAWLAAQLGLGFSRVAARQQIGAMPWLHRAAAVLALSGGVFATMALAVADEPVAYPIGYRADLMVLSWGLAAAASALLVAGVALIEARPSNAATGVASVLFAAGTTASQATLVRGAGLLPGLSWRFDTLGVAVVLQAVLVAGALWLVLVGPGREGRYRRRWRVAGALLLGVALLMGPHVVLAAADLASQIGSAYSERVGPEQAKLLAAVVVPGVLLALAGVLVLGVGDVAPAGLPERRRRRRRWWEMRP